MDEYTQGESQDRLTILKNGDPMTVEEILNTLRMAGQLHCSQSHPHDEMGDVCMPLTQLARQEARIEALEAALHRLDQWSQAYPIDVFPEPDFKRADELLQAAGMGVTAISASNMRHVITRVREIIADVLPPQGEGQT